MANEKEDRANEERDVDKELLALFGDVSHYTWKLHLSP